MSFEEVNVNPQEVRFSQDSISWNFNQSYSSSINENPDFSNGFSLEALLNAIPKPSSLMVVCQQMEKGLIKASDFPPIEVYKDENGIIWSNDNRRFWVFRKAGLTSVTAKLSSTPLFRASPPPEKRGKMFCSDYFPLVRGRW
ncbi:hypothetical protein SUGI_0230210 [Cryptomeria japonica]|uniref:uncharacterized protein LOC131074547 n=1 Tax=Cryptomeria japonica TaxID=3369 RepID=UPI002408CF58|nr:uncharacterized protein LOC131074547 [Cryptomeria japonica]GLJ14297.1 hypothetical protein SUGI_0230210 [Cryptomeria japonica]